MGEISGSPLGRRGRCIVAKGKGKREAAPDDSGNKGGRPTLFRKEFIAQVGKLAQLGALEKQIAEFFEVSEETITYWKRKYPEFLRSLRGGRIIADAEIAYALYHRAKGYRVKATKIFCSDKGGVTKVPYTEVYPPDTPAIKFWLTNRVPKLWRDKVDVEHKVTEQLAARLAAARKRVKKSPGGGEEE